MGFPHPDHLLGLLSATQIADWEEFFAHEPQGEERGDLRMGVMLAALLNAMPGVKRRGGGAFSSSDFVPYLNRESESPRSLWARLTQVFEGIKHGRSGS